MRRGIRPGVGGILLAGLCLLGAAAVRAPAQVLLQAPQQALRTVLVTAVETSEEPSWRGPGAGADLRVAAHGTAVPAVGDLAADNPGFLEVTLSAEALARPRCAFRLAAPIPIAGITKTMGFWARATPPGPVGLRVIVLDASGIELKIPVTGTVTAEWRAYSVAISPYILQRGAEATSTGLSFAGWEILPDGSSGPLVVRLDVVSAVVDLYATESREPDVPEDW